MATKFCYTYKKHVTVTGKDEKDRMRQFHEFGHTNEKVKTLRKGLVGTYPKALSN